MLDIFDKLPVCHDIEDAKGRTKDVILDEEIKFSSFLLEEPIQMGLAKCGYKFLSPIQKNALPFALTGNSIIVHAKSGTGKTLVYLLTALNTYLKHKPEGLFALILAPTREIAKQVYDVCKNVSCFIEGLKVEYFIGGISLDIDVLKCKTCHIAIGAPGRIKHLIDLGELKVRDLRLLVLDEVDLLMNNREFAISEIVSTLPVSRQTLVCTATYNNDIGVLLKPISSDLQYINMNEKRRREDAPSTSNMLIGIKQYVLPVSSDSSVMDSVRKRNALVDLLKNFHYDQCFVFVNYISLVKSVYNFLVKNDLSVVWLSSEQTQSTRMANLNKLKLNECKILVTTDLAARGIDVHNANLVVNLSLPTPPDVYVHRMGRAGRYGSEGSVITIVFEGEELETFKAVVSFVTTESVNLYVLPKEINAESLNASFEVIECDPEPESIVIRELINKHAAKTEHRPMKTQNKKRKQRKTKSRRSSEKRIPPNTSDALNTPDMTESKATMPYAQELEKRLFDYANLLRDKLDRYTQTSVQVNALVQVATPKKSSHTRLVFSDYYEIPSTQEECAFSESCEQIHESLLQLADYSRAENSLMDCQRITVNLHDFFTLIDFDRLMCKRNTPTQTRRLKREILSILRDLLGIPVRNFESAYDSTDSGALRASINKLLKSHHRLSTSTSDSQEPPIKLKPTRPRKNKHISTVFSHLNVSECSLYTSQSTDGSSFPLSRTYELSQIGSRSHEFSPISQEDYLHTLYQNCRLPQDYASTSHQGFESLNARPTISSADSPVAARVIVQVPREDKASRTISVVPMRPAKNRTEHEEAMIAKDVQCPRCCHKFSLDSSWTNRLPSLTPYVNLETERTIYESHLNFISGSVNRVQSSLPDH